VLGPAGTPRIAVEAASPFGWDRWVGERGAIIGMRSFGASAPEGGRLQALRHHTGGGRRAGPRTVEQLRGPDMASAPHTTNANLAALAAAGTAPWLDQIRRGLIASGELARLRDECSLRGVTSNPAIFEQAILGSDDYDDALA
jgi:hypothetical protein